jgi:hypothetical protein
MTGEARANNLTGISVITSGDPDVSSLDTLASGAIGDRVTFTSFVVSLFDRLAGKTNAAATFSFTPSAGGQVSQGGTIAIAYPSRFFLSSPSPAVSLSGGATAAVTSHTDNKVVLTVQSGIVAAATAVTVTLAGFTMGTATADVLNSIEIITSQVMWKIEYRYG